MKNNITLIDNNSIQNKIYTIRDVQVMLDEDLALLYGVETKQLNKVANRSIIIFPDQLTLEECYKHISMDMEYINKECEKHLLRMEQAYSETKSILPLSHHQYSNLQDEEFKNIDQFLFRFSKI